MMYGFRVMIVVLFLDPPVFSRLYPFMTLCLVEFIKPYLLSTLIIINKIPWVKEPSVSLEMG